MRGSLAWYLRSDALGVLGGVLDEEVLRAEARGDGGAASASVDLPMPGGQGTIMRARVGAAAGKDGKVGGGCQEEDGVDEVRKLLVPVEDLGQRREDVARAEQRGREARRAAFLPLAALPAVVRAGDRRGAAVGRRARALLVEDHNFLTNENALTPASPSRAGRHTTAAPNDRALDAVHEIERRARTAHLGLAKHSTASAASPRRDPQIVPVADLNAHAQRSGCGCAQDAPPRRRRHAGGRATRGRFNFILSMRARESAHVRRRARRRGTSVWPV
ncbi:hypothetical protein GGX14DRAFT_392055 [Mycena pura]|uniref:Uncharacterized protein n=1 Tax=Mycena pura TaxID=153505 RepID=A0AAD6VKG2_9AGAR|nr:hypothetical protein GGX14DRAFT_392055 [Mycena pura]